MGSYKKVTGKYGIRNIVNNIRITTYAASWGPGNIEGNTMSSI